MTFSENYKRNVIIFSNTNTIKDTAEYFGRSESTIRDWRKRNPQYITEKKINLKAEYLNIEREKERIKRERKRELNENSFNLRSKRIDNNTYLMKRTQIYEKYNKKIENLNKKQKKFKIISEEKGNSRGINHPIPRFSFTS